MPASESRQPKARFLVRELGRVTWPDLMRIMEKHNGVWGGCWCVAFHVKSAGSDQTAASSRAYNERLVRANQSHAALVYEGWAIQSPPVRSLTRTHSYGAGLNQCSPRPDSVRSELWAQARWL